MSTKTDTRIGRDGGLTPHASLVMACSGSTPLWIDRVGKKPSVKADLAMYSCVLGVSG